MAWAWATTAAGSTRDPPGPPPGTSAPPSRRYWLMSQFWQKPHWKLQPTVAME